MLLDLAEVKGEINVSIFAMLLFLLACDALKSLLSNIDDKAFGVVRVSS